MSIVTAWPSPPTDIGGSDDVTIAALERRPPIVGQPARPQTPLPPPLALRPIAVASPRAFLAS